MDLLDNITNNRPLSTLQKADIIEYQSEYIPKDIFVIYDTDIDNSIPALLLQMWKFKGGYDHGVYNIVINDLDINRAVPILDAIIHHVQIEKIINFREENSNLTDKEKFIMNVKPIKVQGYQDKSYYLPYECEVTIDGETILVNIPDWTPLQKLPVTRIKVGSLVEIWEINSNFSIMKTLKL